MPKMLIILETENLALYEYLTDKNEVYAKFYEPWLIPKKHEENPLYGYMKTHDIPLTKRGQNDA